MINFKTTNNPILGTVLIENIPISTYHIPTRAIIKVKELNIKVELNSGTVPTLNSFLNTSNNLLLNVQEDKVVNISYILLKSINLTGLTYTVGDNLINKEGISSLFVDTDYIYSDRLYKIDKNEIVIL